jgi:hypothetical protein
VAARAPPARFRPALSEEKTDHAEALEQELLELFEACRAALERRR